MQVFQTISSSNKKGAYIINLLRANFDFLKFNSTQTVSIGDELELKFSSSDFNSASYIFNSVSPSVFRVFIMAGVINLINGCTITTLTANGIDINGGIGTDLKLYEGQDIIMIVEATVNTNLTTIGSRQNGASTITMSLSEVTFNGEIFSFPEASGLTTTGSSGTLITKNTSASFPLTYTNNVMTERIG